MQKYILVTGGTKGIGRAIIEKFAAEGFHIITCARNEKDLEELKISIEREFTFSKVHYFACDLGKEAGWNAFLNFVAGLHVRVEVLVNNTGLFIPGKIYEEADTVLPDLMVTNVYSAYYVTRGLVPDMIRRRSGHIFNICSTASIMAYPNGGSYSITKFALYGMTKCLREELKDFGIKVTAVLPGATLTASWEGVDLPQERFMKSEDIGELIYATYTLSKNSVVEELLIRPQLGDIK
jgi:short-subunit dehydrogenase